MFTLTFAMKGLLASFVIFSVLRCYLGTLEWYNTNSFDRLLAWPLYAALFAMPWFALAIAAGL